MSDKLKYSANITGEPFLFYEIRQVAKLMLIGMSDQEIIYEVNKNNLFQYATEKSIAKRLRATINRAHKLDETMLQYLSEKPSETAKIINLYTIMKSNRLVYDFIVEVVGEKLESNYLHLEKKDINEFFLTKREQHEDIARWKDDTIKKLKQVILRILMEAGILDEKDKTSLRRPVIDPDTIRHLNEIGEVGILKAMGINY